MSIAEHRHHAPPIEVYGLRPCVRCCVTPRLDSTINVRHSRINDMIFRILVTVFVFGFALLLGILSIMRALYAPSAYQPPLIPDDPETDVSLDEGQEQPHLSWPTGGMTPDTDFAQGTKDW